MEEGDSHGACHQEAQREDILSGRERENERENEREREGQIQRGTDAERETYAARKTHEDTWK